MAQLFSVPPAVMKPTALVLNILVATIACWKFIRAGRFSWQLLLPLAITSIPFAWVGGYLEVAPGIYRPLVGIALLVAALRFFQVAQHDGQQAASAPPPTDRPTSAPSGRVYFSGLAGSSPSAGELRLRGRIAVVTGGGRGLGQTLVRAFAGLGADVAFSYRESKGPAEETAEELRSIGRRVFVGQADARRQGQIAAFVEAAAGALGGIDVLVNNSPHSRFHDAAAQDRHAKAHGAGATTPPRPERAG